MQKNNSLSPENKTLANRIREIHETIGEDAAILDPTEQVNEESLYAVYEERADQLTLFENDEEEFVDLNAAEEGVWFADEVGPQGDGSVALQWKDAVGVYPAA